MRVDLLVSTASGTHMVVQRTSEPFSLSLSLSLSLSFSFSFSPTRCQTLLFNYSLHSPALRTPSCFVSVQTWTAAIVRSRLVLSSWMFAAICRGSSQQHARGCLIFLTLCLVCILTCHTHISFWLDSNGCIRAPAGWTCSANIPLTQVVARSLHWLRACVSVLLHLISFSLPRRGKPIFTCCMVPYALFLSLWTSPPIALRVDFVWDNPLFLISSFSLCLIELQAEAGERCGWGSWGPMGAGAVGPVQTLISLISASHHEGLCVCDLY